MIIFLNHQSHQKDYSNKNSLRLINFTIMQMIIISP